MTPTLIEILRSELGDDRICNDPVVLATRRFDRWCIKHYRDWMGRTIAAPGIVVRPQCTADVQQLMRFASRHRIAVIPFGLGSGVCGGIEPDPDDILLDMSSMNRVIDIDTTDLLARFEAGINGLEAEQRVAEHGLTIGHWPQSVAISSVGGWVSTRASGQFSTAYGNIEDMVYSLEVVLPSGELAVLGKAPRASAGPDLRHLFMGAEGCLGVITGVTLSLRRQPEKQVVSAFYCPSMAVGFDAQRQIVQADWRPPVMRQYDPSEVARLFPESVSNDRGLLLMVHEGPATRVEVEIAAIESMMLRCGLEPADSTATRAWLERRNHVPEWTDLLDQGLIADTIEVSGTWQQIDRIYHDVTNALRTVPHIVNASAHSSHVYRSGINLYFTFACMPPEREQMEALYFECWDKALASTAAAGGGIAHHHGAGRLRKPYLHHDLGTAGIDLLHRLKRSIDPDGLMNPGNLLPTCDD